VKWCKAEDCNNARCERVAIIATGPRGVTWKCLVCSTLWSTPTPAARVEN
jgi:hypothetical protein